MAANLTTGIGRRGKGSNIKERPLQQSLRKLADVLTQGRTGRRQNKAEEKVCSNSKNKLHAYQIQIIFFLEHRICSLKGSKFIFDAVCSE